MPRHVEYYECDFCSRTFISVDEAEKHERRCGSKNRHYSAKNERGKPVWVLDTTDYDISHGAREPSIRQDNPDD